jgi:DNA-directed RNA polymerase specialized sigma24 family protein
MADLTLNSLNLLLARIDADPSEAAEKYEELRLKLTKCLIWKGCPESQADALVDIILDRIAEKLEKKVEIENLNAYACQVLRFVWLEHRRKNKEDGYEDDKMPEIEVAPIHPEEPDLRLACLRSCLVEIAKDDDERQLIINYYDSDEEEKDKLRRKSIAERLGIKTNALKVRMFRLREQLEKCINECVKKRLSRVTD